MAEDEPNRITRILQKGLGGIKSAYKHPVTQNIGSGAKYTAAAGAGLMGGLAVGTYRGGKWAVQKTGDIWLIFFPILLWLFDYQAGIQGIQFSWNLVGGYDGLLDFFIDFVFRSPYLLFLGLFFIFRGLPSKNELPYYAIVVGLFVFLWGLVGGNLWLFIHLIFAIFVFIFLLKGHDKNVAIDSRHWIFIFIVLWDIFDFPLFELAYNELIGGALINSIIQNKLLFPIWVFYFFTFIRDSVLKKIMLTAIWLFYTGLIGFQFYEIYGDLVTTTAEQQQAVIDAPKRVFTNYANLVKSWLTGRVQYAITGKVEQYEHEPVGVFLEKVRSAEKFYYEGEDAVIWGTIRARTLDDPINVEVGCFVKEGEIEIKTEYVDPKDKFSVFTYEENDFACTMKNLDEDTNRVTAYAEFNFETEAKQKVYLIDRETLRSMTRENIDPFAKEKITDRKPIARFTNGPVKIKMGVSSSDERGSLVGVSESYSPLPTLTIILSNNEGWQGKLTKLRELVILLPEEIELFSTERICDFEPYSEEDCKNSIDENIGVECRETCRISGNQEKCMNECEDKVEELKNDCSNLYAESGQKFDGYKIKLRENVEYDEGENFEEIKCRFRPNLEVLENPGITIKDFRAKTRYVYRVEKPVTVQIEKLEERFIPTIEDYLIKTLTDKQKETGSEVKSIAKKVNFANQDMLTAVAYVESELRHCKDFETVCGKDEVFNKNENYGVMQLNRNTHCAWFYPKICGADSGETPKCSNVYTEIGKDADDDCDIWRGAACTNAQTAYDFDCNVRLGISFLNKLHNQYSAEIEYTCENEKGSVDTTYTNWDAALRAYDGLVCLRTDPLYVEKVNKAMKELEIDSLSATEPTINLRIQSDRSVIKLNWDLTDKSLGEEKVIAYEIYKKTAKEDFIQIQRISKDSDAFKKREYADTNIDLSGQFAYFYYVKAIFDDGSSEKSAEKEFSYVSVQ